MNQFTTEDTELFPFARICVHLRFNKDLNSVPSVSSVVKYHTERNELYYFQLPVQSNNKQRMYKVATINI